MKSILEKRNPRRVTESFQNEIGNPIDLLVEHTRTTGTAQATGKKHKLPAVRLVLTGPTSQSENIITPREAEAIARALGHLGFPRGPIEKRAQISAALKMVEVPYNHHPVEVEPPKKKRKKWPFQGFVDFQGLRIHIENKKGSYREGVDKDGHAWKTYMHWPYGEIEGTEGSDGDALDVYVGPNADSSLVVVVHQHRPNPDGTPGPYDECKVMLGWDTVEDAVTAYKKQYDRPGFYKEGDHLAMPIGQFWRWVHDTRKHGKKVAGVGLSEKVAQKTAGHVEVADPQVVVATMRPVLVCLLGLYHLYFFAHWSSRGEGAYGDHQLFERLYKSVQGEFDSVAERLVGHAGEGALDGVFTLAAAKNAYWMQGSDALHAALGGEAELQSVLHAAYQQLDAGAGLTLGLDELIMGLASAHETNAYLLKQRAQPQVKAAALAPTEDGEPNKLVAGAVGGAGVLGGAAALRGAKPLVTGRETLYHGGGAAAAEEIRQGGLKTREQLGRMGGLTEGIASAEVNEASKNLAFATDKKHIADSYARQAGLAEEYMREHPGVDISKAYQEIRNPADIKRAIRLQLPFGTAGGSVAEMSVPIWKLRQEGKIVPNPEEAHHIDQGAAIFDSMPEEAGFLRDVLKKHHSQQISDALGESGGTYAFKDGLGPEYVRGSKAFQGLTLREVGEYARTHPGRFAGGAGLGVLGAAGVGLGLHHLYKNFAAQPTTPPAAS